MATLKDQILENKNLGNEVYAKGDYAKAIQFYTTAIELYEKENPGTPVHPQLTPEIEAVVACYSNRSAALLQTPDRENTLKAVSDARKSIKLNPEFSKGYLRAGKGLYLLGEFEESLSQYDSYMKKFPKSAQAEQEKTLCQTAIYQLLTAKRLYSEKEYQQALFYYQSVLRTCPYSHANRLHCAETLIQLDKLDEAFKLTGEVLTVDQMNTKALYLRARIFVLKGNFDNAIKILTTALKSDPDATECRNELKKVKALDRLKVEANDAFKAGNHQQAYDLYTEALALDPDNKNFNTTLYANRAAAASKLGKNETAIEDCTKALEHNPSYLKVILRRAQLYMTTKKFEEAVRDFEAAMRIEPTSETKQNLQYAKQELKKSLRKDYYKILEITPDANDDEIKKAYRKQAIKWHPDKNQESEETRVHAEKVFKDISEAYSVLSDPKKRSRYDSGQDLEDNNFSDADVSDIFQMFFRGGGSPFGGGMGGSPFGGMGGNPYGRSAGGGFGPGVKIHWG